MTSTVDVDPGLSRDLPAISGLEMGLLGWSISATRTARQISRNVARHSGLSRDIPAISGRAVGLPVPRAVALRPLPHPTPRRLGVSPSDAVSAAAAAASALPLIAASAISPPPS